MRVNLSDSVPSIEAHGGNFDFRDNLCCRISCHGRPLDVSRAVRLVPQEGSNCFLGVRFLKICHLSRFEKIVCHYSLTECT